MKQTTLRTFIAGVGLAMACAAVACTKNAAPEQAAPAADKAPDKAVEPAPDKAAAAPPAIRATGGKTYARTEAGVMTSVNVERSGSDLTFALATKTGKAECDVTIRGVAKEKEGDMESRDDDQGQGHFVNEYVYESADCGVSVSIDADTQKLAWVAVWDCKLIAESCPALSEKPLALQ